MFILFFFSSVLKLTIQYYGQQHLQLTQRQIANEHYM